MRVIFIIHGAKKGLRQLPKELNNLRPAHQQFYFCFTSDFGSGKQIAYENASKADLITVIGGDGILNECLNGIMIYKRENPTAAIPAITLMPFGSGNDFARNFEWKRKSVNDFILRLEKNDFRQIDIGTIIAENGRLEYFINEASTGLTTKVVERVARMPKAFNGNIKFGWAILEGLLTYKKKTLTIKSDGFEWSGKSLLVACNNGKYFGSGIAIAPDADLQDGFLDVAIIGDVSIFDYLRNLPKLRKGIRINHPQIHYLRTRNLALDGYSRMEKEGEIGSKLPCSISISDNIMILA